MNIDERTQRVKSILLNQGFNSCGVSRAGFLEKEAYDLEKWLQQGRHGTMSWMEHNVDKRLDPRLLVEGAKSVVSVTLNYFPHKELHSNYKIAKYAYGRDYHKVVKKKLLRAMNEIREQIGAIEGRAFVDSAPVMDKAWARRSGLGWIGKNTNLLAKEAGSFFFIGELIIDLELTPDGPVTDHCGTCTRCIDACPTDALSAPYEIDGSRCISYLTIELKDQIPEEFRNKTEGWIFGCDICQDVCPWNRHSQPTHVEDFHPKGGLKDLMENQHWEEVTEEVFEKIFNGSPVKRAKYEGFKRNLTFTQLSEPPQSNDP